MLKLPVNSIRNTIFIRLVATYLFVILPLIILGVYLYNWSYQYASQEVSKNSQAQLSAYLDGLNREIEWLEIQQYDILQDEELNKMVLTWDMMSTVERKASLHYLLPRLVSIKNSSVYIKDVFIHIRSIDKTISAMTAMNAFDSRRYNHVFAGEANGNQRLLQIDDTFHLVAAKYGARKGEEPLLIVQIELDASKLRESLMQISVYPESGAFIVSEPSGFALASHEEADRFMKEAVQAIQHANRQILNIGTGRYLIDKAYSDKLDLSVFTYLPTEAVKRPLSKFYVWAWLFAGTTLLAIAIYAVSTYKLVHKPLLLLVQSFRKMEDGMFNIRIKHGQRDEFGYLYDRFNQMLIKLQHLIDQDFRHKLMMQRAELKQLQSQINPHFLYNSFFILSSLAKTGDVTQIELFTNMLGEYFRFITRNDADNVPLLEETRHSRIYTEIQKLRFSRRIRVEFGELPKEMEAIKVPRLIIQPIIENAYEHSLEKMQDEGLLRVSFHLDDQEASIVIEENGNGLTDNDIEMLNKRLERTAESAESPEVTGLINIHRRIALTYGESSGLVLSRSPLNGLRVQIRIRLTEGNEHV
ncbi:MULTISPECIES: histidine kinase [Paenibacillus]|uniref:Two-component system sensor histidine kinase YesM n=1 Tax=Paenibacillus lactis TaxID=228574 RepID=A0ABS4FF99_9BACL|nr:histidine kinase [Paenibacillus lactis]MBP1894924.1 two-component system sensor histidine kinase YesM [Paenibacillus lactis]HAF96840.1 two-component sensor histidine kinase [Paenibacillus lactis]